MSQAARICGVGNLHRASGSVIQQLLARALVDPVQRPIADGLARPGKDGTLKARMIDTAAEGRLAAKTGTANRGVALSGIVDVESDSPLVFSAIVDHTLALDNSRAFLDALGATISELHAR